MHFSKMNSAVLALLLTMGVQANAQLSPTGETADFDRSETFTAPSELPFEDFQTWDQVDDLETVAIDNNGNLLTSTQELEISDDVAKEFQGWVISGPPSVQGDDERKQIKSTIAWPYRAIGRIDIGCTGTLIGPRHVLTAGHCLYNIRTKKFYQNLNFSPAQSNETTKPYGTIRWKTALTVKGYTKNHKREFDYGLIILDEDVGNKLGWMGFGYNNNLGTNNQININGYPGDKPRGTLWHSFCPVQTALPLWLHYMCDTAGGMSGSAVYVYDTAKNSRIIYAVHTYGGPSYNKGNRLDQDKFEKLKEWKTAN